MSRLGFAKDGEKRDEKAVVHVIGCEIGKLTSFLLEKSRHVCENKDGKKNSKAQTKRKEDGREGRRRNSK